jgi:hypothetical protein
LALHGDPVDADHDNSVGMDFIMPTLGAILRWFPKKEIPAGFSRHSGRLSLVIPAKAGIQWERRWAGFPPSRE